ncbi:hypothetical protein ACF1A1_38450, partial [Streptomyces sp. NPDC014995]
QPDRLRDSFRNNINYADTSRITRVQDSGSGPDVPRHAEPARPHAPRSETDVPKDAKPAQPAQLPAQPVQQPAQPVQQPATPAQ